MKKGIRNIASLLVFLLATSFCANSQTVFWTETFNNGCVSGCLASGVNTGNGAWSIDNTGGCNDALANEWFISCAENGNAVGTCGSGCGANATLHIGANDGFFLDIGASYDAGGFGGCGNGGTFTYTRAVSPIISTVGKSGITVTFNYLEFGDGLIDDGWVEYSTNGGGTWSLLANTAKTTCCGGACNSFRQGRWANYLSGALPIAADNNPNLRLRFVWTNNDDGIGNDPSYAINDLKLMYTVLLPIRLMDFAAKYDNNENIVDINWSTATETNNSFFTVEKTVDGENYSPIATVKGAGNSSVAKYYTAVDPSPYEGISYYRLKQTDYDGHFTYSNPAEVNVVNTNRIKLFPNPAGSTLNVSCYSPSINTASTLYIYDNAGRMLTSHTVTSTYSGMNTYQFDISELARGMYIVKIETSVGQAIFGKFIKQ